MTRTKKPADSASKNGQSSASGYTKPLSNKPAEKPPAIDPNLAEEDGQTKPPIISEKLLDLRKRKREEEGEDFTDFESLIAEELTVLHNEVGALKSTTKKVLLEQKVARIERAQAIRRSKSNTLVIQGHGINAMRINNEKLRSEAITKVFTIIGIELTGKFELCGATPILSKRNKNKPKSETFPLIEARFVGSNLFDFLIYSTSYQQKLKEYHAEVRRTGNRLPMYAISENLPPLFQARNGYLFEVDITRTFAIKVQDRRMGSDDAKKVIPYWRVTKDLAKFLPKDRTIPE